MYARAHAHAQVSDIYRKMRGTLRFMLGNLEGFDPKVSGSRSL